MPDPQIPSTPTDSAAPEAGGPPAAGPPVRRGRRRPFARRRAARRLLRDGHEAALARAGYHFGVVPYGYRPLFVPVPEPDGSLRRRIRLLVDPVPAATVAAIYRWRVAGRLDHHAIAERLAADPYTHPAPADPFGGAARRWSAEAVGCILSEPAYTGATVWVPATAGRRAARPKVWVVCLHAHEPIVDGRRFLDAHLLAAPRAVAPALRAWEFPAGTAEAGRRGEPGTPPPGEASSSSSGGDGDSRGGQSTGGDAGRRGEPDALPPGNVADVGGGTGGGVGGGVGHRAEPGGFPPGEATHAGGGAGRRGVVGGLPAADVPDPDGAGHGGHGGAERAA